MLPLFLDVNCTNWRIVGLQSDAQRHKAEDIPPLAAQYGLNDCLQSHQSWSRLKGEEAVYCQPTASKLSGQDSLW